MGAAYSVDSGIAVYAFDICENSYSADYDISNQYVCSGNVGYLNLYNGSDCQGDAFTVEALDASEYTVECDIDAPKCDYASVKVYQDVPCDSEYITVPIAVNECAVSTDTTSVQYGCTDMALTAKAY